MDFGLNPEQEALQRDIWDFLEEECPISLVRECEIGVGETVDPHKKGYSPQLYHKMAERGWVGISLPAQYGGGGKSYLELAVLFEQMGRVLCPSPQFASEVLCGQVISTLGAEAQKQRLLRGIIKEEQVFTLAWQEGDGGSQAITTRAERMAGGFVLYGEKTQVPWAYTADALLVLARTSGVAEDLGGLTLFLLDPRDSRIVLTPLKSISGEQLSAVTLRGVIVPEEHIIGDVDLAGPALFQVIDRAKVIKAAEAIGLAARAFQLALDYSKTRVQFGRPIATFQALQHMLADVATMVDGARLLVYEAAWRIGARLPADAEIAAAKAYAGDVAQWASREAQQVMGGINYMKDRDIQLYYRRAKAAQLSLGGSEAEKERFAQLLGL